MSAACSKEGAFHCREFRNMWLGSSPVRFLPRSKDGDMIVDGIIDTSLEGYLVRSLRFRNGLVAGLIRRCRGVKFRSVRRRGENDSL